MVVILLLDIGTIMWLLDLRKNYKKRVCECLVSTWREICGDGARWYIIIIVSPHACQFLNTRKSPVIFVYNSMKKCII